MHLVCNKHHDSAMFKVVDRLENAPNLRKGVKPDDHGRSSNIVADVGKDRRNRTCTDGL